MKSFFLLLICLISVAFCRQTDTYTAATVSGSQVRAISITETPAGAPRFVSVSAIAASSNTNSAVLDAVQFNMTTCNQSTLSFGYIHESYQQGNNGQNAQVEAFFFAFQSFFIFEFLNLDGIPGYQQSNGSNADQIISAYDMTKPQLTWHPIVINTTVVMSSSGQPFKVSTIEAQTTDNVFFIRFVVTEQPIYVGNTLITADKSKIDFGIRYYNPLHVPAPWSTGVSNATNAQIGYVSAAFSAELFAAFHNGTGSSGNSMVTFGSGNVVGSFTWAPTAQVTVAGVEAAGAVYAQVTTTSGSVNAAVFEAYSFRILLFSFQGLRPDYIYWDPILGADIVYPTTSSSSFVSYITYLILLACAAAIY
jgi:hypothetical protein